MADIFLSYSHLDRPLVRPVVELLESEGWTVWWDRGIEPGMPWLPELEAEMGRSRALVVMWSRRSVRSRWVRREAAGGRSGTLIRFQAVSRERRVARAGGAEFATHDDEV